MKRSSDEWSDPTLPAVIFDLDGVIVDSEIWWHQERVAWAVGLGLEWDEDDSRAVMGANSRGWARIMRERMGLPIAAEPEIEAEIVRRVVGRYAEGAPDIPGAIDAIRRIARNHPVAIASSAHRAVIDAALRATGLAALIPVVVSSDEVAHGKPAPDVYLEAARRLGVEPEACLVVEDSINGVRAAVAAGMTVVLVPNASVPPDPEARRIAQHTMDRLADLDPTFVSGPAAGAPGAGGRRSA
jgi:HAD superfamily hydrolase (TIGR01509 family)